MKINSIYISAFGGIKNLSLDLSDGFNVIYGENENGKTTVMAFIKCMFYGTGNKKQKLSESIREKYTPWDGTPMGGRVFFCDKGVNYCLEKEFRKSDSTDKTTLINKDTGDEIIVSGNIGEKFFNLSAQAFERSVFIDNEVSFGDDAVADADFNTKLSSAASSGDTDISEQKVLKRLADAKKAVFSVSGRAGSLVADKTELEKLNNNLLRFQNEAEQRTEISDKIEEYKHKLSELEAEYDRVKKITDSENDIKNAAKLKEYLELKNELDKLNQTVTDKDGNVINQGFLSGVTIGLQAYDKNAEKANILSEEIGALKEELQTAKEDAEKSISGISSSLEGKIKTLESEKEELSKQITEKSEKIDSLKSHLEEIGTKTQKINIPLFIIGILFGVSATVTEILLSNIYICAALAIAAVVFILLGLFIKPKSKRKAELENQLEVISKELVLLQEKKAKVSEEKANSISEMSSLNSSVEAKKAIVLQRETDIKVKEKQLEEITALKNKAESETLLYFSKLKTVGSINEIVNELSAYTEIFEKQKEIKTKLTLIAKDLDNISYEEAADKLEKLNNSSCIESGEDFDEKKKKLEYLGEKITNTKTYISSLETELKTAFRDFISPQTVKRQIVELKEKIRSKEEFCNAVDIAMEVISESAQSMRKTYGTTLENDALEIFSSITSGKYSTLSVSKDFNMRAEKSETFGTHDIEYLSKGTVNGAYLSLRLAISSLLSKDNPLPVFLDDALSQFDDVRQANAIKFLYEYSKENQIILFTCHDNIILLAENAGAETKRPF